MKTESHILADKITEVIGSWWFLCIQSMLLCFYIWINASATKPFDPYPFILLNLVLSFQAAYTAPVILMSHNRMAERDRILAASDRENTRKILEHIALLEKNLIKEVDEAVSEITEAVEAEETK